MAAAIRLENVNLNLNLNFDFVVFRPDFFKIYLIILNESCTKKYFGNVWQRIQKLKVQEGVTIVEELVLALFLCLLNFQLKQQTTKLSKICKIGQTKNGTTKECLLVFGTTINTTARLLALLGAGLLDWLFRTGCFGCNLEATFATLALT